MCITAIVNHVRTCPRPQGRIPDGGFILFLSRRGMTSVKLNCIKIMLSKLLFLLKWHHTDIKLDLNWSWTLNWIKKLLFPWTLSILSNQDFLTSRNVTLMTSNWIEIAEDQRSFYHECIINWGISKWELKSLFESLNARTANHESWNHNI